MSSQGPPAPSRRKLPAFLTVRDLGADPEDPDRDLDDGTGSEAVLEERMPGLRAAREAASDRFRRRLAEHNDDGAEPENFGWATLLRRLDDRVRAVVDAVANRTSQGPEWDVGLFLSPEDVARALDDCEEDYRSMADQLAPWG
jgi:hypothetical protein